MSARGKRSPRRRAGRSILAIWIPAAMHQELRKAAAAETKSQRQVVEAALRAYLARPLPEPAAP